MKAFILLAGMACLSFFGFGQRVAVNLNNTAVKDSTSLFEVRKTGFSKVRIATEDYINDTAVLELSHRTNASYEGTDVRLSAIREDGLFITTASDVPSNRQDSLFTLRTNGNIGAGIRSPNYPLQLHTPQSTINYLNVTNSLTGVNSADGLIVGMNGSSGRIANLEAGDLRLATNNLTRLAISSAGNVGVNTLAPAYRLDVVGDANITGALRLNGTPGVAGQVLTSNGATAPTWENAAYTNNVRFAFDFTKNTGGNGVAVTTATKYNLNPAAVTLSGGVLTFNQSGLYHFDVSFTASRTYTTAPTDFPFVDIRFLAGASTFYALYENLALTPTNTANTQFYSSQKLSIEMYVTAPTTLNVYHQFGSAVTTATLFGNMVGHLISP